MGSYFTYGGKLFIQLGFGGLATWGCGGMDPPRGLSQLVRDASTGEFF